MSRIFNVFVLWFFITIVTSTTALCGRRGSPAFRAAENIIDNSTSRDWSVLRCFLARVVRQPAERDEPRPFFNCILKGVGINMPTVTATTVDEILLGIKVKSPRTGGLVGLRHCLANPMSCPEVRHILVCRQAMDEVYSSRSKALPPNRIT